MFVKILLQARNLLHRTTYYLNDREQRLYCSCPSSVKFMPESRVVNLRNNRVLINIGANTVVRGELLTYMHGGSIDIGDYCYIGEDSRIWSANRIYIGNRVLIAHNVNIHDANDHPINPIERHEHYKKIITTGHPKQVNMKSAEINIEDDVWIGFNSIILKGVTIGRGSIIAAGTVVDRDIEPFTIVAGNPARIIRMIDKNE